MNISSFLQILSKSHKGIRGYQILSLSSPHLSLGISSWKLCLQPSDISPQKNVAKISSCSRCRWYSSQTLIHGNQQDKNTRCGNTKNGFSPVKIEELKKNLSNSVKYMFLQSYDYNLTHKEITMESNFFATDRIYKGMFLYAVELLKMRLYLHFSYADVAVSIKETSLLESDDFIIRVSWKLSAVSPRHVVKFWRYLSERITIEDEDFEVINGISDFYIGSDGTVRKHKLKRIR
ncbi:uncharacterized protein LOC106071733 [Biomphalaria glabrata]|uniref:Uncharacterized protein LOC106071733 n=1 Tax=Biomphalaria glabrata TaxID=6526 RepID=A0A9W3BFR0_BIOGL|nr:uncharacterized protein LOC106071733 [Biomphalaria glabrata]